EAAYDRIHALELDDNEGVTILPGTRDALAALPPERSAIVTSCTRPLAAARMAASGLVAPSVVVTADDVAHGKPNPDPFLLGARRLGVDPRRCLVVEDAPAGVASGRAAGCAVVVVTGTHSADELAAASPAPDALAAGLAALRFVVGPAGVRVTDACLLRRTWGCLPPSSPDAPEPHVRRAVDAWSSVDARAQRGGDHLRRGGVDLGELV